MFLRLRRQAPTLSPVVRPPAPFVVDGQQFLLRGLDYLSEVLDGVRQSGGLWCYSTNPTACRQFDADTSIRFHRTAGSGVKSCPRAISDPAQ
jgi:hypothetical protein